METVTRDDELRAQLHRMWNGVAAGWAEHAEFTDARGAAVTERLLELAAPQPGERVLDLATGAGGMGLAAVERVGPGGEGVLAGVAFEVVGMAERRAARRVSRARQRERPRPRPGADRLAGLLLRGRLLPRGDHARARPGARRRRDPARAPAGWPRGAGGLGAARAEPVARRRLRRG